jgi:DHA1 family bicyclomycin/chloramphenicol resistance-like MFS transporter
MTSKIFTQSFLILSVLLLVVISAAVETDIFLPSFPALKDYFNTTERTIQLLISVNFLGVYIATFFYGPLADAFGRRPILLIGMFIFSVSSIACALVNSLEAMLLCRFAQGLGSSVAFIIPKTIIHDSFDRAKVAKTLGIYTSIMTIVISFAPIIGNYLYLTFSWHANFSFVAILSIVSFLYAFIFLPESLHKEKRLNIHAKNILSNYKKIITTPLAMANLFLCYSVGGAYFAYITNMSLIFVNHLGVSNTHYGYYQSTILLAVAATSFSVGRIIDLIGVYHTRTLGVVITLIGSLCFFAVALWAEKNPLFITLSMAVFASGSALSAGIFSADYINVNPHIKGLAASVGRSITVLVVLILITTSSFFFNGTIMPVAIIVLIAGVSSFFVYEGLRRYEKV